MIDPIATWSRLLDRLESELRDARTAFEQHGDVRLAGFMPPPGLPPLPGALGPRAKRLADDQAAFESMVQARLVAVSSELTTHTSSASAVGGPARHASRFETRV